jgi:hypothetical protein
LNVSYGESTYYEHLIGRDEVIVCPPLTYDIIEISVYSYNSYSTYELTVTEYDMPFPPINYFFTLFWTEDPQFPSGVTGALVEIGEGFPAFVSSFFLYPFPQIYRFNILNSKLTCRLHVESNGNTQLSFVLNGHKYDVTPSSYFGRSYFDVSFCNNSSLLSNTSLLFHVKTSDIQFDVFDTTDDLMEVFPLHNLYILDSVNVLSSGVFVRLPDTLPCGMSNVWSSVSSSPFNPPQNFLFSTNVTFADIAWKLPNRSSVDDKVVYTYILLDKDYLGTAEDVMNAFNFSFGPALVDQNGNRLTGDGTIRPAVKKNIMCDNETISILLGDLNIVLENLVNLNIQDISESYSAFIQSDIIQSNLTWLACGEQIRYMNGSTSIGSEQICGDDVCTSLNFGMYLIDMELIDAGVCAFSAEMLLDSTVDATWYKGCKESVYSVTTGKMGRPCVTDEDCTYPWGNNTNLTYFAFDESCPFRSVSLVPPQCDTFLGICGDTQREAEELFWWCFVNNMSLNVQLTLSLRNIDVCNISQLIDSFTSDDCVSVSGTGMTALPYRSHYTYEAPVTSVETNDFADDNTIASHCGCAVAVGSQYSLCLDELCNKPPPCEYTSYDRAPNSLLLPSEKSVKNDVCSFSLVSQSNDTQGCLSDFRCNWNPSLSGRSGNMSECVPSDSEHMMFCGVHFRVEDVFYREIVNLPQASCEEIGGKVCISPLGSVLLDAVTSDLCENTGYCNVYCPSNRSQWNCLPTDRSNSSICYNASDAMKEELCQLMSGLWTENSDGNVCIFPLQNNLAECERNGNTFIDCQSLSTDECAVNEYLSCFLSNTSTLCQTKGECENSGIGSCSDSEYFVNYMTSPPTIGACVMPFQIEITDKGIRQYCYLNTIPLSLGYAVIPMTNYLDISEIYFYFYVVKFFSLTRCINYYIVDENDCTRANGRFYFPSKSEEECLSYSYCWSTQSVVTGLLTPPNGNGECFKGETVRNLFQWNKAKWIGGTWALTNWTKRQAVSANAIRITTNFTLLQSVVSTPAVISLKTFLQNQVCKMNGMVTCEKRNALRQKGEK